MNPQLLIDAVVRQTMVLIAQLATTGGARTPLSHLAHQVFVELAGELESQGLSRKVTADMFGISLRSYQRKVNRLNESVTERGKTLWEAVYDYLAAAPSRQRAAVLKRFSRDDAVSVRGILRDLVDSGLVFMTGQGDTATYRVVAVDEVADQGILEQDTLVWVVVYREGPLSAAQLSARLHAEPQELEAALQRLVTSGRVQQQATDGGTLYSAQRFVVERDAAAGWEAAVYDHFQSVVKTICARLDPDTAQEGHREHIGGSTYSLDIDTTHPLSGEVLGTLARLRGELSDLRNRVNAINAGRPLNDAERVVIYAGQCVLPHEPAAIPPENDGDRARTAASRTQGVSK